MKCMKSMNDKKVYIGNNLMFLRKANNMTLEDVANKINVSRQAISKWESSQSIPDILNCLELANLYDVTVDDLLHHNNGDEEVGIAPKGKYLFGTTIIGERGQVVIPKEARETLNLETGDVLVVLGDENPNTKGIALVPRELFTQTAKEIMDAVFPNISNKQGDV